MKLKKQFKDFYDEICIHEESDTLQKDIEDKFPGEMKDHGIELKKSDIEIFDQGSYKYSTTIKSSVIDRDVAVMIPLDIKEYPDSRKIKGYLRDAVNHVAARTVKIKEPCVNVSYYENGVEWMHIDLPLYAKSDDKVYLARGKEFSEKYLWEIADPKGLNDDLCGKINKNEQLRRVIRYIKKWRNDKYENSTLDHEVPPSIGLTYLACDCFVSSATSEGEDDLMALQQTMSNMKSMFTLTYEDEKLVKADISRYLPVEPFTDVFQKMKDASDSYGVTFYNRLSTAVLEEENLLRHTIGDLWVDCSKVFGLKCELERIHPEIHINAVEKNIDKNLLVAEMKKADLILFAVGSSTVQWEMNKILKEQKCNVKVIYTWLEAGGENSHILSIDYNKQGCFQCLFTDEQGCLINNKANNVSEIDVEAYKIRNGCGGTRVENYSSVIGCN